MSLAFAITSGSTGGAGTVPAPPAVTGAWLSGLAYWTMKYGNLWLAGYQGRLTPPAGTNTAHITAIRISRITGDQRTLLLSLAGPFVVGDGRDWKSDAVDVLVSGPVTLEFVTENEDGTTATYTTTVTLAAPTEASVTAAEATPISTTRHQTENRGVRCVLNFTPVVTNPLWPLPITVWTNHPLGVRKHRGVLEMQGTGMMTLGTVGTKSEFDIIPPTAADESWTLTYAIGSFDEQTAPPASAKTSAPFTMLRPPAPGATDATGAYVDAITYAGRMFGMPHIYATLPLTSNNFLHAGLWLQTGSGVGGSFIPGGAHAVPQNVGEWVGDDDHTDGFFRTPGTNQIYCKVSNVWDVPTDGNITHRLWWVVASRRDGATEVQQNCWSSGVGVSTPGTAAYQDVVVDGSKSLIPPSGMQAPGNVTIGTPTYTDLGNGKYQLRVPYTPPAADPVFTAILAEVELPDQSGGTVLKLDGTTPLDGTTAAVGDHAPLSFGPFADDAAHQVSVVVSAPGTAQTARIRLRSASADFVNPASTSPSVTLALPAYNAAPKPASGSAFTACATWGATPATVTAPYNLNGKMDQDITFAGIAAPTDPMFSGWEIWSSGWPDDAEFYQETPTQQRDATGITITLAAPKRAINVAFWLVSVSIDAAGNVRRNPIVSGVTPATTVALGTTSGTVDLTSVLTGSFDPAEFQRNPSTGIFETLAVNMAKAANLSSQFAMVGPLQSITNLSAGLLVTGLLQVGGGANKVSQAKIFDAAGTSLIGWIGDDTGAGGSGYVGAWFKQVLIGGTSPATAQFAADASGNVTMAGDLITSGTLKVGGGAGKPGKLNIYDHTGNSIGWVGDDTAASGYVGAWFKQLLIGGTTPATAKIVADASGNVSFAGNITGTAANITGTLNVTQLGTGNLPVGVAYLGAVQCSQLQAGTINAAISLTSASLTVTSGTRILSVNAADYFKVTDSATGIELAMNPLNLYIKYATGPSAGLVTQLLPGSVHTANAGGFNTGHNASNFYCQSTSGVFGSFTYLKVGGGTGTVTFMGGIVTSIT